MAARAKFGSSLFAITISNPLGSSDIRPNVNPENNAENATKTTMRKYCTPIGNPIPSPFSSVEHGTGAVAAAAGFEVDS